MSDLEEILGETPPVVEEKVETPAEDQPAKAAENGETPTDEPQEPTPAETQTETPADKEEHTVPLAVFQSMRNDLKAQIDSALEAAKQPAPQPEPVKVPDILEDPDGFTGFMGDQLQKIQQSTRAEMSEVMAIEAYGQDVVNEAFAAAKASGEGARFLNSRHPYGDMVKWHKQQRVLQEIGDDPDAYRQKIETEVRQKIEADIAAQQAKQMAAQAPPSMAKTNGTGGSADPGWQGPTTLDSIIGE